MTGGGQALPTDLYGLIGIAVINLAVVAVVYLQGRGQRSSVTKVGEKVSEVHDQVHNRHSTNLRDDITDVLRKTDAVREQVARMQDTDIRDINSSMVRVAGELYGVRVGLEEERRARELLEQRFNSRECGSGGNPGGAFPFSPPATGRHHAAD